MKIIQVSKFISSHKWSFLVKAESRELCGIVFLEDYVLKTLLSQSNNAWKKHSLPNVHKLLAEQQKKQLYQKMFRDMV